MAEEKKLYYVEVKERLVGMIVDSVSDVVSIPASHIQKEIQFSARVDTDSIEGIGKLEEDLIIILDVENFLEDAKELEM